MVKILFLRAMSALVTAMALLAGSGAQASVVLQVNASGILTGATGLKVVNTYYDVAFKDGTCIALFHGCDAPSDFPFDWGTAIAASTVLMTDVFMGTFDTQPRLIQGCNSSANTSNQCYVYTPWGFDATFLYAIAAHNMALESGDGVLTDTRYVQAGDSSFAPTLTYAVWTVSADQGSPSSTVPEPSSLVLLGVGLAGLMGVRQRKPG